MLVKDLIRELQKLDQNKSVKIVDSIFVNINGGPEQTIIESAVTQVNELLDGEVTLLTNNAMKFFGCKCEEKKVGKQQSFIN